MHWLCSLFAHRCDETCPNGTFGMNCSITCECENEAVCNYADGTCLCNPGYVGER